MLKLFSVVKGAGLLWPLLAIFATLTTALAGTGWLLKKSYESNGQLSSQIEQWQAANDAWSASWQAREQQFESAQLRLQQLSRDFQQIKEARNAFEQELQTVLRDRPAADCGVRPDIWLLLEERAKAANRSLSGD